MLRQSERRLIDVTVFTSSTIANLLSIQRLPFFCSDVSAQYLISVWNYRAGLRIIFSQHYCHCHTCRLGHRSRYRPETDTFTPPFSIILLRGSSSDVRREACTYVAGILAICCSLCFKKSFVITIIWNPCVVKVTEMHFWWHRLFEGEGEVGWWESNQITERHCPAGSTPCARSSKFRSQPGDQLSWVR